MFSQIYKKLTALLRENIIRQLVEGLSERKDGHYTINHMKRFVRSASLSPALAYAGYLSRMSPAVLPFAYRFNPDDIRSEDLQGSLLEVPATIGFS